MRVSKKIVTLLAVFLVWAAYSRLIMFFWGYFASINPIFNWAVSALLPEYRAWFYALIYTSDILINTLLVLPLGYLFSKCSRQSLWGPVFVSVSLVFLWDYWQIFGEEGSGLAFFTSFGAIFGVLNAVGLLPLAYYLVEKLRSDQWRSD